jgi:hypothetical protein
MFYSRNFSSIARLLSACILLSVGSVAFYLAATQHSVNYTQYLPRPALTPGAIDPRVTQANISTTICVPGYTKTVRPPVTYTSPLKRKQLASGYNLNGDVNPRDYEEDHLIPLEVGGNPTSVKNLFPEPLRGPYGALEKDKLENQMHLLVCTHKISLAAAQKVFAPNWVLGYIRYIGPINANF